MANQVNDRYGAAAATAHDTACYRHTTDWPVRVKCALQAPPPCSPFPLHRNTVKKKREREKSPSVTWRHLAANFGTRWYIPSRLVASPSGQCWN